MKSTCHLTVIPYLSTGFDLSISWLDAPRQTGWSVLDVEEAVICRQNVSGVWKMQGQPFSITSWFLPTFRTLRVEGTASIIRYALESQATIFVMDVWWIPTLSHVKIWNLPVETTIKKGSPIMYPGWWFQIVCMFIPTWGRFPIWLIFSSGLKPPTSNEFRIFRQRKMCFSWVHVTVVCLEATTSSQVWEIFISRAPSGRIGVPGWQDVGLENGNKGDGCNGFEGS